MKIITDIEQANSLLQTYKGARIQAHLYSSSLKKMALRLFFNDKHEVIYIVCLGCESMNGKFSFTIDDLLIVSQIDATGESIVELIDKKSDFQLISSGGISLAVGLETEFGNSLENLILGLNTI